MGTTGKSALKSKLFGVDGGAHTTAAAGGKASEAQVTRTSGGRSINVEREISTLGMFFILNLLEG